jgi:hypothetical protein
MGFGMAIRGYQFVCAFWEVVAANHCKGWQLLCFPCISAFAGVDDAQNTEVYAHVTGLTLDRADSRRRRAARSSVEVVTITRQRSSIATSLPAGTDPQAEPKASQHFAVGRPLSHPLYGTGWAVEQVDATFVVCFPDGSSAKYAHAISQQCLPPRSRTGPAVANDRCCRCTEYELDADFVIDEPEAPTRPWIRANSTQGFEQLARVNAIFSADGKPSEPAQPLPCIFHKYRGHGIVEELPPSCSFLQWLDKLSLIFTVRAAAPCRQHSSPASAPVA